MKAHDTALLQSLAKEFNLTYTAFGSHITEEGAPAYGTLTLSDAWGAALEPAPVSPIDAPEYALLSGTIKATYNAHRGLSAQSDKVIVAPGIMTGNTGTCLPPCALCRDFPYMSFGADNGDGGCVQIPGTIGR